VKCGVNQCENGVHKCINGRECIHDEESWSYTCTDCNGPYFLNNGLFGCQASYQLIIVIIIPIFILLILCFVIFYLTQRKLDLYLPNNWLWERNHLIKEVYTPSNTDPVYYFKEIDNNEHDQERMWVSQENQLFEGAFGI